MELIRLRGRDCHGSSQPQPQIFRNEDGTPRGKGVTSGLCNDIHSNQIAPVARPVHDIERHFFVVKLMNLQEVY